MNEASQRCQLLIVLVSKQIHFYYFPAFVRDGSKAVLAPSGYRTASTGT